MKKHYFKFNDFYKQHFSGYIEDGCDFIKDGLKDTYKFNYYEDSGEPSYNLFIQLNDKPGVNDMLIYVDARWEHGKYYMIVDYNNDSNIYDLKNMKYLFDV